MALSLVTGLFALGAGLAGFATSRLLVAQRATWGALAGLVTLALAAGAAGQPRAASASGDAAGVPFQLTPYAMPVETPQGQSVLLDAAATPVIVVRPTASAAAQGIPAVETALHHLRNPRIVVLMATGFPDPAHAPATLTQWIRTNHVTLPTVIQEGSPTLYVQQTPTLLAADGPHLVHITGAAAITAWIRQHGSLATVLPPAPAPKR